MQLCQQCSETSFPSATRREKTGSFFTTEKMGFKLFILSLTLLAVDVSASSICKCSPAEEKAKIFQDSPAIDPVAKYRLKLKKDDGREYDEEVQIDTQKETETFHVPKTSPDNEEADIVLDFKKNYMMVRMPEAKVCFLSQSTENAPKPADLARLLDKDAGSTINQNRPELKFKVLGTLDDNARGDLNDEMADLCAKLPIKVVVKVDRAPTDVASDDAPVKRIKRHSTCRRRCYYVYRRSCFLFFCSSYYERQCGTVCD